MRAISLWQPWATLIVIGEKHFETRSWETLYRGEILIHAAKRATSDLRDTSRDEPFKTALQRGGYDSWADLPLGALIGRCQIERCYETADVTARFRAGLRHAEFEEQFGDYYPGRFAWQLSNFQRFLKPIPWRGEQGFFQVPETAFLTRPELDAEGTQPTEAREE